MPSFKVSFLLLLPVVLACSATERAESGSDLEAAPSAQDEASLEPTVTDSAGVLIRTWPANALDELRWSVDPAPFFVANGSEGGHQLFHLIASMAFDSDTTIVLGEMAMTRLRRYVTDGEFIELVGTSGQGPGEFGAMNHLGFHHDSLVVFDSRWNRMSVFDSQYEYVRSFSLEPQGSARFEGLLSDGRILALLSGGRGARRWGIWDLEGELVQMLDSVPGLPALTMAMLGPSSHGEVPRLTPYKPNPAGGAAGRSVAWIDGSDYRIDFFDPQRGHFLSERIDRPAPAVTEELKERWRSNYLANVRDRPNAAVMERAAAEAEFPERLPAMGPLSALPGAVAILHDDLDRTWVRVHPMAPTQEWLVIDQDAGLLGYIALPASFELEAVRGDMLLGVAEDELEVQTAVGYRFRMR